jgi:hypothetical protein
MRNAEWYAEDYDTGDMINNEVYKNALESAGFDSITHDADIFTGMDVESGTKHTIMLRPENIRSVNAMFDPSQKGNIGLMKTAAPVGIGLGAYSLNEEENKDANSQRIY